MEKNKNSDAELTFIQPAPIAPPVAAPIPTPTAAPVTPPPTASQAIPHQFQAPTNTPLQKQIFFVGFWKRVAILSIDNFFLSAIIFFFPLFGGLAWLGNIILYYRKGQTIGDLVMRTKLVDQRTGLKPSGFQLTIRYLSKTLSWLILGIGFFCVAWRKEKNAWHDSISSTRYIETKNYSGGITWLVNIMVLIVLPGFAMPNAIKEHAELIQTIQPFLPESIQQNSNNETNSEPEIIESDEEALKEDENLIDETLANEPATEISEDSLESDLEANIFNSDNEEPIDTENSGTDFDEEKFRELQSLVEQKLENNELNVDNLDPEKDPVIITNNDSVTTELSEEKIGLLNDLINNPNLFEEVKTEEIDPIPEEKKEEIISAEPVRFPGSFYFKKEGKIYYQDTLIEDADVDTFMPIDSSLNFQKFWATDKNNVYAEGGKIVAEADPQSFELLHSKYATDGKNVFYLSQKMHADAPSFQIFQAEFGTFTKDDHTVFFNGQPFEIADVPSFEETETGLIQDKNNIYDRFGKIEKRQKVKAGVKRMPRPKN